MRRGLDSGTFRRRRAPNYGGGAADAARVWAHERDRGWWGRFTVAGAVTVPGGLLRRRPPHPPVGAGGWYSMPAADKMPSRWKRQIRPQPAVSRLTLERLSSGAYVCSVPFFGMRARIH